MYTVKWFEILLFIKDSYLIKHQSIVCIKLNCSMLSKWLRGSIWPTHGILIGITTPGQSEPGSNGNERGLHIPPNSWTGASPSDAI